MAAEYFDARPPQGYGIQRALTPTVSDDTGASILRQGIRYHQQAEYDLALVAFRAYFEDNPEIDDPLPAALAASAAIASGVYDEAPMFLAELPESDVTRLWLQALLELREEDFGAAKQLLGALDQTQGNPYPAADLMDRLP